MNESNLNTCLQKLQDVITDIVEESNEVQDSLLQGQSVPDQLDEDDLFGGETKLITSTTKFLHVNWSCKCPD